MAKIDEELMQELLKAFHDEAVDHVEAINASLLKVERSPEPKALKKLLQTAFRAAHSLKGAARAVNFDNVEALADGLESILQLARDTDYTLDPDVCDLMYDALDMIQNSLNGQTITPADLLARLGNVLDEASATVDEATHAAAPGEPQGKTSQVEARVDPIEKPPATPENEQSAPQSTNNENEKERPLTGGLTSDETIRVSVEKLDDLIAQVGELLVSRINAEQRLSDARTIQQKLGIWTKSWRELNTLLVHNKAELGPQAEDIAERQGEYLKELTQSINTFIQSFNSDTLRLGMVTGDLQDKVRRVRMVPFQTIALGLERAVRDAAHSEQKEVNFRIVGQEIELDKKILESLKAPLMHLLRNAVGHGIEKADEREKRGKLAIGQVSLSIQQRGSEVHIKVADDGRGFDVEALRRAASSDGQGGYSDTSTPDDLIQYAFSPGVTTAPEVTAISGRGVGLDVVNQELEAIQGRIEVENNPGQGVTINLIVPTSLSMTRELMVQIGSEFYGLPLQSVEKIIEPEDRMLVGGKAMVNLDGYTLPLVSLASILERPVAESRENDLGFAIIIGIADQRLALLVDNVLTEQELAVKSLEWPLKRVRNVSGVALLGDGKPVVILNPTDLIRSANHVQMGASIIHEKSNDESKPSTHVLVVDDSITTRTLEKNILSAAGYTVTTATNGVEALDRLSEHAIEIVVSDVQMPQMDGIELTRALRDMQEYTTLPVILVTSLESEADREQGMMAGADAYIVKRGFDQAELLSTIQQLLVGR